MDARYTKICSNFSGIFCTTAGGVGMRIGSPFPRRIFNDLNALSYKSPSRFFIDFKPRSALFSFTHQEIHPLTVPSVDSFTQVCVSIHCQCRLSANKSSCLSCSLFCERTTLVFLCETIFVLRRMSFFFLHTDFSNELFTRCFQYTIYLPRNWRILFVHPRAFDEVGWSTDLLFFVTDALCRVLYFIRLCHLASQVVPSVRNDRTGLSFQYSLDLAASYLRFLCRSDSHGSVSLIASLPTFLGLTFVHEPLSVPSMSSGTSSPLTS